MAKVRYAELCYPGLLFPETEEIKVSKKTTAKELFDKRYKDGCYRIDFYTQTEKKSGKEVLTGGRKGEKKSYLLGKAYTLKEMKARRPALDRVLISNVEINNWKGAVECLPGNWQPWDGDIEIIEPSKKQLQYVEKRRSA